MISGTTEEVEGCSDDCAEVKLLRPRRLRMRSTLALMSQVQHVGKRLSSHRRLYSADILNHLVVVVSSFLQSERFDYLFKQSALSPKTAQTSPSLLSRASSTA